MLIHIHWPQDKKVLGKKSQNPYSKVPIAVTKADAERGIELAQEYLAEIKEKKE